jgi:hypothetical protein
MSTPMHNSDVVISGNFVHRISPVEIGRVLEAIRFTMQSDILDDIELYLDGIVYLEINEYKFNIHIRFQDISAIFSNGDDEALNHDRLNFTLHLLAKIDEVSPLISSSHHADFRSFLHLRHYYGLSDSE